jgi:hypothetical protein
MKEMTTMDKWHGGRELARFSKSSCEDVRLTLENFGCGRYVDVRVWSKVRPSDNAPSSPTEHGIVLDADLLPEFRRAIDRAIVALGGDLGSNDPKLTETKP